MTTYNPRAARTELTTDLYGQLQKMTDTIRAARQAELNGASNAEVYVDDFDALLKLLQPVQDKLAEVFYGSLTVVVLEPTVPECVSADRLTMEDVWGKYDLVKHKRISTGMLVARGYGEVSQHFTQADKDRLIAQLPEICPVWGDELGYKSVTVICPADVETQVQYWLEHVQGGNCIVNRKVLADGKVALRSNYMAW